MNSSAVQIVTCKCGIVHYMSNCLGMLGSGIESVTIKVGVPFEPEKLANAKSQEIIEMLTRKINLGSLIGICNEGFCVRPMDQPPGLVRDAICKTITSEGQIINQFHALGKTCNGVCRLCKCSFGTKVKV